MSSGQFGCTNTAIFCSISVHGASLRGSRGSRPEAGIGADPLRADMEPQSRRKHLLGPRGNYMARWSRPARIDLFFGSAAMSAQCPVLHCATAAPRNEICATRIRDARLYTCGHVCRVARTKQQHPHIYLFWLWSFAAGLICWLGWPCRK